MPSRSRLQVSITALRTRLEGARLALLNWPGGHPDWLAIATAAGPNRRGANRGYRGTVQPLLDHRLIEELPREAFPALPRFRLTQRGRKALDILQSGVE